MADRVAYETQASSSEEELPSPTKLLAGLREESKNKNAKVVRRSYFLPSAAVEHFAQQDTKPTTPVQQAESQDDTKGLDVEPEVSPTHSGHCNEIVAVPFIPGYGRFETQQEG